MLVLVLGDIHIPHRAPEIPEKFKNMLAKAREDKRIGTILCTGNLVDKSMLDYLRTFCHDVKVVAGEFDEAKLPEQEVVTIGAFKIGLIHGHQVCDVTRRTMTHTHTRTHIHPPPDCAVGRLRVPRDVPKEA